MTNQCQGSSILLTLGSTCNHRWALPGELLRDVYGNYVAPDSEQAEAPRTSVISHRSRWMCPGSKRFEHRGGATDLVLSRWGMDGDGDGGGRDVTTAGVTPC